MSYTINYNGLEIELETAEDVAAEIQTLGHYGYDVWHNDKLIVSVWNDMFTGKQIVNEICQECDMLNVLTDGLCQQCTSLMIHNSGLS